MTYLFFILVAGAGLASLTRWAVLRRRRASLLAAPLSDPHRRIAHNRIPLFRRLPEAERRRLEGLVNRFLSEVEFLGGDGLDVTDDMRVTIAAQACMLIVNKPNRWYDSLRTLVVYEGAFKARVLQRDGHLEMQRDSVRIGESWGKGPVVLSWEHAAYGAFVDRDGHNVVMHEFAHQLDDQTGTTDGSPLLDADHSASRWARVFRDAYQRLVADVEASRPTLLDGYGATSPAEFFAVATETFFERPETLRDCEPALYAELSTYYRLDPAG